MQTKYAKALLADIPKEELRLDKHKEMPCKDVDLDCMALDGQVPFGDYRRCYEYAPELGKCVFYEWEKDHQQKQT
jgi:hypothetical protein